LFINKPIKIFISPEHLRHYILISFLILSISLFSSNISASSFPREFTVYYKASISIFSGETKISLTADTDDRYVYESATKITGFMSFIGVNLLEKSVLKYINGRARPLTYTYKNSKSKKRNAELTFDWEKKIVTNSIDSKPWKLAINPDTLDKLVYQLVMMDDLRQGKKKLNYSIADGGKLKEYNISIVGKEKLKTKLGEFNTLKLSRISGSRTTTIWCAIELGYLPVRISQKKKGGSDHAAEIFKLEGFEKIWPKDPTE